MGDHFTSVSDDQFNWCVQTFSKIETIYICCNRFTVIKHSRMKTTMICLTGILFFFSVAVIAQYDHYDKYNQASIL